MGHAELGDTRYLKERLAKAEAGNTEAYYDLGLIYSTGHGVPRDFVEAHKWFNLAAIHGSRRAVVDRQELACEMTNIDIANAQKKARAWMAAR